MRLKHLYLIIAIIGTAVPLSYFIRFLMEHGFQPGLFSDQMFGSRIASFFAWDVIISTLAVFVLVITEGKRRGMRYRWAYILMNLMVGVSLALPAFLYARQLKIDQPN